MNNSYERFKDFTNSKGVYTYSDSYKNYKPFYDQLKLKIINNEFDLKDCLSKALKEDEIEHLSILIELIRCWYLLKVFDYTLYNFLLRVGIKLVKEQKESISTKKMKNVCQILDINFHQSHLVEKKSINNDLYFELCLNLLDPRFMDFPNPMKGPYRGCLYFIMSSSGFYNINRKYIEEIKPLIEPIIHNVYGKDHHFSVAWIKLLQEFHTEKTDNKS